MLYTLLLIAPFCDTLPSDELLFQSLDYYYQQQGAAELAEYDCKIKHQWLKYLPTVGLTYTLDGKPRPAISWSSNLIYTNQREKATTAAKKKSILKKNKLALQAAQLQLKTLLLEYQYLEEELVLKLSAFEIDKLLYEVSQDQEQHLEITPTEFLKAKKDYLKRQQDLLTARHQIQKLESQILQTAKYQYHE